jgi:O-antigen ligase
LLLLRYTSNEHRLRILIHVVIGIGVASAVFGILRQVFQGSAPNQILSQLSADRSFAQFIDRNHFAFLIEMALGLVLALMLSRGMRRDHRLIYFALALLLWAAVVLSSSRGGIFTLLCQLLFLVLLFSAPQSSSSTFREEASRTRSWLQRLNKSFVLRAALVICLLLGVTISIVWVGGDPLMHRLETMPREFSTNDDDSQRLNTRRVEIWQATWQMIKVHPIAGIGFGAYWISFPRYHDASGAFTPDEAQFRPLAAHNDYLELVASGGVIGVALGTWFVISLIRCSLERLHSSRDSFHRAARLGALVGMFGIGVHSLVDFGLHDTVNAFVFASLVVIAIVPTDVSTARIWRQEVSTTSR